jgi:hypothetical protein
VYVVEIYLYVSVAEKCIICAKILVTIDCRVILICIEHVAVTHPAYNAMHTAYLDRHNV